MPAIVSFLGSAVGVLTNPAALLLIAAAYVGGYWRGDARSDAQHELASVKADLQTAKDDNQNLIRAAADAKRQAEESAAMASANQSIIEEIRGHASKGCACTLSADDSRRLRNIR